MVEALQRLQALLVPGELVNAVAIQRRLFALKHRRALVAATTGRLIFMDRGLFGGFHSATIRWQDLKEARLDVGVFGATLTVSYYSTPDLAISGATSVHTFGGLQKVPAEGVYRLCQAQDQAWREKRRVRELEELRAKSGGIQLSPAMVGAGGGASVAATGDDDAVGRLQQAKEMLSKGLISDSEYEALKARIVNTL